MDNRLHNKESAGLAGCNSNEIRGHDHEKEFIRIVSDHVMDVLNVNWNDRRIAGALLQSSLNKILFDGRDGLLEQYLHTQLDIIAKTIRDKFDLDDSVKVNYNHATHAKLKDLLEASKDKMTEEQDND